MKRIEIKLMWIELPKKENLFKKEADQNIRLRHSAAPQ